MPSTLGTLSLNHWTTKGIPKWAILIITVKDAVYIEMIILLNSFCKTLTLWLHVSALEEFRTLAHPESRENTDSVCYHQILLGVLNVKDYGDNERVLADSFGRDPYTPFHLFFFFRRILWSEKLKETIHSRDNVPEVQYKWKVLSGNGAKGKRNSIHQQWNEWVLCVSVFSIKNFLWR